MHSRFAVVVATWLNVTVEAQTSSIPRALAVATPFLKPDY
jgi:hypothetical protein